MKSRPLGDPLLPLSLRHLTHNPTRTLMSVLAVGFAVALVLVFEGFQAGVYDQMRDFSRELPADLVVTQEGVSNLTIVRSNLPQPTVMAARELPGVANAQAMACLPQILEHEGLMSPVLVMVYRELGGPKHLLSGRLPDATGEVVVDQALAKVFALELGETLRALDHDFTVVGISERSSAVFTPFVYARRKDLVALFARQGLMSADPTVGFLLVQLRPEADPLALRAQLAALPGVSVFTREELADSDEGMAKEFAGPLMRLLVGLAWAMGLSAVALTLFSSVLSRGPELATMKAIGTTTTRLVAGVLGEAALLAVMAFVVAVLLSGAMGVAIEEAAPAYRVLPWERGALLRTLCATLVMAALGGLLPTVHLSRLDPATVFRS